MTTLHRLLLAIALLASFATQEVLAARAGPRPILAQMDEGYAVVAAEVVESKTIKSQNNHVTAVAATFRIKEIFAHPVAGAPLAAKPGESIRVELSVGYSAQFEQGFPPLLEPSQRFLLTLKPDSGDRYIHATGASAALRVAEFSDEDRKRYARLRSLAEIPKKDRPAKWVAAFADATMSEAFRSDVISGLTDHEFMRSLSPDQRDEIVDGLRLIWNDRKAVLSSLLVHSLDYALRSLRSLTFERSEERAKMWVVRLFEPTPANLKDDNDRDNRVMQVLVDLMTVRPEIMSPPAVAMLADEGWPTTYRRAVGSAILLCYERAHEPDPTWEPALQAHFSRVLRSKEAWPIRLVSNDISGSDNRRPRTRSFVPDAALKQALTQALVDMKAAAAKKPVDPNAEVAVGEVERAIDYVESAGKR